MEIILIFLNSLYYFFFMKHIDVGQGFDIDVTGDWTGWKTLGKLDCF